MTQQTVIFLFSLPRSGSTFVQRVLGNHPAVATATEPHFLLPLLTSLQPFGSYAEYEHQMTTWAIQEFCQNYLPEQLEDYRQEIRTLAKNLYAKATPNGERYFLDKTPRYHILASELVELFSQAKFIVLWRNPLAVVASMNSTFYDSRWFTYLWEFDLYQGLDSLLETYGAHRERIHAVRYEDIVNRPQETLSRLFDYVGLSFEPEILETFEQVEMKGHYRDPYADLPDYQQINEGPLAKWKEFYTNPLRKRWARGYLDWIGRERLALMGYELDGLLEQLNAIPTRLHHLPEDLLRMPYGRFSRVFESHLIRDKLRKLRRGDRQFMLK